MRLMPAELIQARDDDTTDQFVKALRNGFSSQTNADAFSASLAFSLGLAAAVALLFCFLRPYNNVVYAPRAKYADSKHAPPPVNPGLFGWVPPLIRTKEQDLVERVGLDAAVFMRVVRMLRNIFSVVTIIGVGILIPVNVISGRNTKYNTWYDAVSVQAVGWSSGAFWAYPAVAYLVDATILFFLWINYRAVAKLRREYFNSAEYQRSLHARTLLITDVPQELRSDEGLARITDEVQATPDMPRTAIARNVKDLPELVEEHGKTVRELEEHLAKYLKNPDQLPAQRPTCKPHKSDKSYGSYPRGSKVDAIEYLTGRIKELELEIREVRETIDRRNALSYGFASYQSIPTAHSVAFAARNKGPHKTIVRLAPKPNDLVWKNLNMSKQQRGRQNFINGIWIFLLTVFWIIPNLFIAIFLSNLNNLANIWPGFKKEYYKHTVLWAIVQGVLAPALTTLFYFYLPAIFRKLCINAGDVTKTSRERHVFRSLYNFFCLNNFIVFSLFGTVFAIVAAAISGGVQWDKEREHILNKIVLGLSSVGTYWTTYLLQRNLGAAVDLSQLFTLTWGSISRKYFSPTPRRLIELSAPQPLDYAAYYNYFIFYSTVAVSFAAIQPLVLPVTALYFWMDSFMKKYLILYVFITKYESGGMFWRSIFNRMVFLTLLGNVVIALVVASGGQGEDNQLTVVTWPKLAAMIPLPFIILGFKWYCARTFDREIHFVGKGQGLADGGEMATGDGKKRKGDRVAVRFGHPVLYKPLITPMVAAKSQHLLKSIYTGRMDEDEASHVAGYSDVYMDNMDRRRPGKTTTGAAPANWEIVNENEMDFEYFKNRPEFRDEAGGDGELFGHAQDMIRPGTPSSAMTDFTHRRTDTFDSGYSGHNRSGSGSQDPYSRNRSESRDSMRKGGDLGMVYPAGYHQAGYTTRDQSPAGSERGYEARGHVARQDSRDRLMDMAAPPGMSGLDHLGAAPGGYGPVRYGNVPGQESGYNSNEDENTSYDSFRRGRQR